MIKLLGFDLDDTLWDNRPVMIRAEKILAEFLEEAVSGYQHKPETLGPIRQKVMDQHPELIGKITLFREKILYLALAAHGLPETQAHTMAQRAMDVFLDARSQIELFPGVRDMLETLCDAYTLCALSNGNSSVTAVGLDHVFKFHINADQVAAPKPAPDMFQEALARQNLNPSHMVYIGDHPTMDVDAAASIGIKTVWLDHGRKDKPKHTPNAVIQDILDLPQALTSLQA